MTSLEDPNFNQVIGTTPAQSFVIVAQGAENQLLFSVSDAGTVELGVGVTVDEAARAFWDTVQSVGGKYRDTVLEEVAQWYASEGWLLDEDYVPDAIRALKEKK